MLRGLEDYCFGGSVNFCPSCGNALTGNQPKFCGECGALLQGAEQETHSQPTSESAEQADTLMGPEFYDSMAPFHDGDRNWRATLGERTIAFAEEWFGHPTVSTADLFGQVDPEVGASLLEQGAWEGNTSLSTSFVLLPHGFETGQTPNPRVDEVVPWQQAECGRRVMDVISSQGLAMAPANDRIAGWWPTPGGGTCVQFACVMAAVNGVEYLHWYAIPLASLGTMLDNEVARVALTASIPSLLQTVTYLAECPTPMEPALASAGGGRGQVLYGPQSGAMGLPIPVTALVMKDDSESAGYYALDQSTGLVQPYPSGGAIIHGYAIPLDGGDYLLSRGIQIATSSAVRFAAILEDGYTNYTEGESSFHSMLWSQAGAITGSDQMWVPTSLM